MKEAALVTGGAVRLGRAFALQLAARRYDIVLHYNSSKEEALDAARDIEALGSRCYLTRADLSQGTGSLIQGLPPGVNLTLLVNSASFYESGNIASISESAYQKIMRVNLETPFFLMQQFRKRVRTGAIINILDNKIAMAQHDYSAYVASKKALADCTIMAAREFAPSIRVNGIAPGVILPQSDRSSAYLEWRIQNIPLGRQGEVQHLEKALAYLLDNDFITGQILFVDGGESLPAGGRNFAAFGNDR